MAPRSRAKDRCSRWYWSGHSSFNTTTRINGLRFHALTSLGSAPSSPPLYLASLSCVEQAAVEYLNGRGLPKGTGSHGMAVYVRERIRPRRSTPTQEGWPVDRRHTQTSGREALCCECGSTPRTQRQSASDLQRTTPEADTAQHGVTAAATDTETALAAEGVQRSTRFLDSLVNSRT